MTLPSSINLINPQTRQRFPAAPDKSVVLSSSQAGWCQDLILEVHRLMPMELPEHYLEGHRLIINLGGAVRFGWRSDGRTNEAVFPPGGLCLQSDGETNAPFWQDEIPHMLRQGGGIIINTASVGGHQGFSNIAPYGASKAGVMSLTRTGAMELTGKNIRINSFSPGAVDTPMLRRALSSWGMTTEVAAKEYPINRLATPEEMARVVMWLSSSDATIMVGTDIDATGGYLTK